MDEFAGKPLPETSDPILVELLSEGSLVSPKVIYFHHVGCAETGWHAWYRLVRADGTESLGFMSLADAELVLGMHPLITTWVTRLSIVDPSGLSPCERQSRTLH